MAHVYDTNIQYEICMNTHQTLKIEDLLCDGY